MTLKAHWLAIPILLLVVKLSYGAATVEQDVTAADARFWRAYDDCDMERMGELLTDDVEFYHDVTGLTVSRSAVVESLRKGPCGDRTLRLRRELVNGSQKFQPLAGGYAILSGEHRFYVNQPGKQERVGSQAEFVTVWKQDEGRWRMHRILSYAHAAPPYIPPTSSLTLPGATLDKYAGQYIAERAGPIAVVREGDHLQLTAGSFVATLYAETPTRFFAKERDIHFEFEMTGNGTVQGLAVYENGAVSERAQRSK
ncbi:DUF4440 domain-containing protein [Steroidobacter flavus]|uniref:DUF4440 domain-containing protein n=2 Tax=Steroidobacter flavus TaxID=1842136 RepID=A0ABV8SRI2_9GAMM